LRIPELVQQLETCEASGGSSTYDAEIESLRNRVETLSEEMEFLTQRCDPTLSLAEFTAQLQQLESDAQEWANAVQNGLSCNFVPHRFCNASGCNEIVDACED